MLNLKETRLVTRVIYGQWLPNIVYDIHQMGSSGARLFVPPFFDPKNPNVHPLNDHMMLIIGGHMAAELTRAGRKGILNSAMYDNWWQGGFRTTAYRHNITGMDFVQDGGTLICIDRSCNLPIEHFNVPVRNILSGKSSKEFYCPGSILRISVDQKHPVGYGCPQWVSGYFAGSQAFELIEESKKEDKDPRSPGVRFPARVVARYSDTILLESGWIRGKELIADKPAIVEVQYGRGKIILLGFRVQHRR